MLEVVVAVIVDVSAVVLEIETEDGEKEHVGYSELVAPEGAEVTEQERLTDPVNELPGVTVMVEVLLELCATVMLPLLERVKLVVPVLGFCQKSPQPAKSGAAASNNRVHFPIFIAAP
ncbi:MAG: hypothetical protein ABSE51_10660 [Terracidiphilus sp.]